MKRATPCSHTWRWTGHLDGCHWYAHMYKCGGCGEEQTVEAERDPNAPYVREFMDPVNCERCRELVEAA